jgi:hypothetical protein
VSAYEEHALQALIDGPPGYGSGPRPGEAVPIARWVGERHGAVLMLRLRRDGIWDGTTLHFERYRGGWELYLGAGGPWGDPTDRPLEGWDGAHIDWFGASEAGNVRVVRGQVSGSVTRLVMDPAGAGHALEIEPITGAYLAGNEGTESLRLVAYDADGASVDEAEIAPSGLPFD